MRLLEACPLSYDQDRTRGYMPDTSSVSNLSETQGIDTPLYDWYYSFMQDCVGREETS